MDNDMEMPKQNALPTSPYPIADYKTRSSAPPPPPQKRSRRWLLLWLLLLIPLIAIGTLLTKRPVTSTVLVPVTTTAAPLATSTSVVATATAITAATQSPATTVATSPQPTGTLVTPTAPSGGVAVTISPTTVSVACGNATTTVMLTNPSTTQTAQWRTITTGLYTLTPSSGSVPPGGQQKMMIANVSEPGIVTVVSGGIPSTITITCTVGTLAQNHESMHEA